MLYIRTQHMRHVTGRRVGHDLLLIIHVVTAFYYDYRDFISVNELYVETVTYSLWPP